MVNKGETIGGIVGHVFEAMAERQAAEHIDTYLALVCQTDIGLPGTAVDKLLGRMLDADYDIDKENAGANELLCRRRGSAQYETAIPAIQG